MDNDAGFQTRRDRLRQAVRDFQALLGDANSALDVIALDSLSETSLRRFEALSSELETMARGYADQSSAFLHYLGEQATKIEEAKKKAAMAKKSPAPARDQAKIQQLSEQLTRDLRLERIDEAIKELLGFLSDADFFEANASTGRRRRLRTLQNAIDKALQK